MIIIQNLEPGSSKEESMKEFFSDIKQHQICPDVADESAITDQLSWPIWVETTKILPGPMAKNEYDRATRLDAENLELKKRIKELESRDNVHRSDKGKKHKKTPRGWKSQADMAEDFSKNAKKIGGKWYGKVTIPTVKDWETRYPDETKRERKSGYHARLRNVHNPTSETKKAYLNAASNWNSYWGKHNAAFNTWLKTNPKGDHATFLKTWERPGKTLHRSDTDKTMRYGADTSFPNSLDSGDFDNKI